MMPSDKSWDERKNWEGPIATSSDFQHSASATSEIVAVSTDYETKMVSLEIGAREENWFVIEVGGNPAFGPLRHQSDGEQTYEETFEDPIIEAGAQSSIVVKNIEAIATGVGISMKLYERRGPE